MVIDMDHIAGGGWSGPSTAVLRSMTAGFADVGILRVGGVWRSRKLERPGAFLPDCFWCMGGTQLWWVVMGVGGWFGACYYIHRLYNYAPPRPMWTNIICYYFFSLQRSRNLHNTEWPVTGADVQVRYATI